MFLLVFKNPLLSAGRMRFLKTKKLDQLLTYKKANLGPIFNFRAYVYISLSGAFKLKAQEKFIGKLGTSIGQHALFTLTLPVPLPLQTMALPIFWLVLFVFQVFIYSSMSDCFLLVVLSKVCDALERMVAFFESLQSEGFTITDFSRVKRLHSDRAGEFTAPYFERFLTKHKSIYHTFTSGYDPQANGTAERTVGLVKSLAARALATAQLDSSYWSYPVRYAAQSLLCHALQRHQRSLPFGSSVVAQELDHKKIKFPDSRTVTGRLVFWDHMQDQVSYILVPPGDDNIDFLVYRASMPARLPPAMNVDELTGTDPLPPSPSRPTIFDRPMQDRMVEEEMTRNPLDLDPLPVNRPLHHHDSTDDRSKDSSTYPTLPDDNRRDKDDINNDNLNDEDDDDVIVEYSLADAHSSLPADCPFTFLYLSSEDSTREDPSHDTDQDLSLPDSSSTRQGTTHVSVTADEVLRSTGVSDW